jgi:hypothetical protein
MKILKIIALKFKKYMYDLSTMLQILGKFQKSRLMQSCKPKEALKSKFVQQEKL